MLGLSRRRREPAPAAAGAPLGRQQGLPAHQSLLPHFLTSFMRPPAWQAIGGQTGPRKDPEVRYKRQEYLVGAPSLPGTAIRWTLFHPTYIPGLQGYPEVLPFNFGWQWGRNNFERFGALAALTARPSAAGQGTRLNTWKPVMQPQRFGDGRVWRVPKPWYIPPLLNPSGGRGDR